MMRIHTIDKKTSKVRKHKFKDVKEKQVQETPAAGTPGRVWIHWGKLSLQLAYLGTGNFGR
jgi:hypothetical protein